MRVVMLSDLESSGGAAVAASRLADALVREGMEIIRLVGHPDGREHRWTTYALSTRRQQISLSGLGKISPWLRRHASALVTRLRLRNLLQVLRPDVINVHNLHGAGWGHELVSLSARRAATVWTLHDMWSFTGRCAYSYDCRRFVTGCDESCPTPGEYPALDRKLIAGAWKVRGRLFAEHSDLAAICPSEWLANEARAGFWADHRVYVIPNGLPLDVYLPVDRALARTALGIDSGGPALLAVAQSFTERRKGGAALVEALQKLRNRPLTLITLGKGYLPIETDGISVHRLGYVDHERTRVLAYNAADLLVHPAPVDNLPNVIMEAVACGTPCVAFAVGGVPDMVRPGITGWLAQDLTPQALADRIDEAIDAIRHGVDLRLSCRALAQAEYDAEMQGKRYLALFQSL